MHSDNCVGCGSARATPQSIWGQAVMRCNSCGLVYASVMAAMNYGDAYAGEDTLYSDHLAALDRFQSVSDVQPLLLPFEKRILELIRHRSSIASVADVGCGTGRFLRAAGELCSSAIGYEVADVLVQRLKHHGRKVVQGGLGKFLESGDGSWDAISLLEVIEHLETPGKIVKDLFMRKKPELLFVVVPDSATRRKFDGRFARHDVPPNHLSWWGEASLKALLEQTGYRARVEGISESRRALVGHLYRKVRGEKSESGAGDWLGAVFNPPTFWLLGIAERA